jgi:hypothetical protein
MLLGTVVTVQPHASVNERRSDRDRTCPRTLVTKPCVNQRVLPTPRRQTGSTRRSSISRLPLRARIVLGSQVSWRAEWFSTEQPPPIHPA